ncbi:hypothetical protein JI735_33725 (plasmid) [Paenibacillus sonchi]|uniref:Uncharacterized protein n=1 Tax=Paenibacillus sonchi TaxID=373687 RepID=A0A974PJT0_9BACL|nr:hypothetical protein [Paenibacillus sonchi]QQZ64612.1 hypothetical protein JI735_33725 [Paenibacillus sonchi]
MIDEWIGQTDLFLSVFSPGYLGRIAGIKSRDVLLSLMPKLGVIDVVPTLASEIQEVLSDYDLNDPLQELHQLKRELQEWEVHLKEWEIRRDNFQLKIALQSTLEQVEAEDEQLKSIQHQIQKLELDEPPLQPDCIAAWEEELAELGREYREEVAAWQRLNAAAQGDGGNQREFFERQKLLEAKKERCQLLLDHGYVLRDQIAKEHKAFEEDLADYHARIHQELQLLRQEEQLLEARKSIRYNSERWSKELVRIQKEIDDSTIERDRLLRDISCIQAFMLQYAQLQVEAANRRLNLAEICLTVRSGSDGEVILHHRLLFNNREYYLLSNPEKFRCAFELSNLAKIMLGISIPIFMDDGDWEAVEVDMQYFVTSHVSQANLDYHVYAA